MHIFITLFRSVNNCSFFKYSEEVPTKLGETVDEHLLNAKLEELQAKLAEKTSLCEQRADAEAKLQQLTM